MAADPHNPSAEARVNRNPGPSGVLLKYRRRRRRRRSPEKKETVVTHIQFIRTYDEHVNVLRESCQRKSESVNTNPDCMESWYLAQQVSPATSPCSSVWSPVRTQTRTPLAPSPVPHRPQSTIQEQEHQPGSFPT